MADKEQSPELVAIRVLWRSPEPEVAAELVSLAFMESGIASFQVLTPGETGLFDEGPSGRKPGDAEHGIVAYFPPDGKEQALARELSEALSRLASTLDFSFHLTLAPHEDRNWRERYKEFFHTRRVGERLVIRPSWEEYRPEPGDLVISMDPGMAFGTGTHATTSLCLWLLERHLAPGARLLDVGTGSGILMIAGAKLGAGFSVGVDNDADALGVARENLAGNGIGGERYGLACGDLCAMLSCGSFSVVTANIEARPVMRLVRELGPELAPGTLLIASGILFEQAGDVCTVLANNAFEIIEKKASQGWWVCCAKKV